MTTVTRKTARNATRKALEMNARLFTTSKIALCTLFATGLAGLLPATVHAHRTWLVPSASVVDGKEPVVSFDAAVSEDLFEYDTNALQVDALTVVAPDGSRVAPDNRTGTRRRTSFDVKLLQTGTYRVSGFSESLVASYKVSGEAKRWRGTPDAFKQDFVARELPADAQEVQVTHMQSRVDTYVTNDRAGNAGVDPLGVGLELIPLTVPTDLSVGDTSRFRLVLDGKPVAGADVTVLRGGNRYRYKLGEIALKTDAQGLFSVQWPEAGRYWIGASQGARGPGSGGTVAQPARRASTSATVEVLPQ